MRTLILLTAAMQLAVAAGAEAQSWPAHQPLTVADQHREALARLHTQSDDQAALARDHALAAGLTVLEIQAQRQPTPNAPTYQPALQTLERERDHRVRATARRERSTAAVTEIDTWLDRPSQ